MSEIKLEKKIGYIFNNVDLLRQALSHRSVQGKNNERLELLGDSLLNWTITDAIYKQFPQGQEGQLSQLRSHLVRGVTLTEIAHDFELSDHIKLGVGEMRSGSHRRSSILADALEAIIAAIYLDSDQETCQSCILKWYEDRLSNLTLDDAVKDSKTQLQEYLQAKQESLPNYQIDRISGPEHDQQFLVSCHVKAFDFITHGKATNRRKAEQEAARLFLIQLEKKGLIK